MYKFIFPVIRNLLSLQEAQAQSPVWILSVFFCIRMAQDVESKPIPVNVEILLSCIRLGQELLPVSD